MASNMNPSQLKLDQFPIVSAIVIFEKPKSKNVCLYAHNQNAPSITVNCCQQVPIEYLFRGHYHLVVTDPPEPFAIYWDNYRQGVVARIIAIISLIVLIGLALGGTVALTKILQEEIESINYSTYCPKQYLYAKEENVETKQEVQFIRNCFCERLNILQLAFGW